MSYLSRFKCFKASSESAIGLSADVRLGALAPAPSAPLVTGMAALMRKLLGPRAKHQRIVSTAAFTFIVPVKRVEERAKNRPNDILSEQD